MDDMRLPGDELGLCPCGHRAAMCHRTNAARWCPLGDAEIIAAPNSIDLRLILDALPDPMHPRYDSDICDRLTAIQVLLADIVGDEDPGNVPASRAYLASFTKALFAATEDDSENEPPDFPANDGFDVTACDGSKDCQGAIHIHGCFAESKP